MNAKMTNLTPLFFAGAAAAAIALAPAAFADSLPCVNDDGTACVTTPEGGVATAGPEGASGAIPGGPAGYAGPEGVTAGTPGGPEGVAGTEGASGVIPGGPEGTAGPEGVTAGTPGGPEGVAGPEGASGVIPGGPEGTAGPEGVTAGTPGAGQKVRPGLTAQAPPSPEQDPALRAPRAVTAACSATARPSRRRNQLPGLGAAAALGSVVPHQRIG